MRVDEAKEAVLISSFTQAKDASFRRPYEVGIVILRLMPEVALWPREQLLYHRYPMKPGMEQKRTLYSTALTIPDLIVRRGKKLL